MSEDHDRWARLSRLSPVALTDENTRQAVAEGGQRVREMLDHFTDPTATWASLGQDAGWVHNLSVDLATLLLQVDNAVHELTGADGAPQDFGS